MRVVLFDPSHRHWLFPFTHTRPVADFRAGILTIRESWAIIAGGTLHPAATSSASDGDDSADTLYVNGSVMPDIRAWPDLQALKPGEAIVFGDVLLAFRPEEALVADDHNAEALGLRLARKAPNWPFWVLEYPWQLVQWNDVLLRRNFALLTEGRMSAPIPEGNQVIHKEHIFLEEGAKVSCSVLNASNGPIYIGRNAEIMEGCLIRGPFSLGEGAILKMGAKVYGATTLGPHCVAGGELKNVVMMGYSNKGHDGYLGDALIGEWCNLGAGTSNSNVRNNATPVRVWNPGKGRAEVAGPKAGLYMGDYSRAAIQTAFHTGAVVGVCCNVFGSGPCSGYLPDFSWGLGGERYDWDKALRDIDNWKKLKGQHLTENEIQILRPIFEV